MYKTVASLLAFNCLCAIGITAQIIYSERFVEKLMSQNTNDTLKEHFEGILNLLQKCGDEYTHFDIRKVSHLFENNTVQLKGPIYEVLAIAQITLLWFFVVMVVVFYISTVMHYNSIYKKK